MKTARPCSSKAYTSEKAIMPAVFKNYLFCLFAPTDFLFLLFLQLSQRLFLPFAQPEQPEPPEQPQLQPPLRRQRTSAAAASANITARTM
jgi:hypothetical protein